MAPSEEISDATDWLDTAIPQFSRVETAMRCQVCKDFYDTPMMTSCAHTFCSLCIRKCLSGDGRCPTCREQDQASKLRRNWAIQEVVDAFVGARAQALGVAREHRAAEESGKHASRRSKRKRAVEEEGEEGRAAKSPRQTRSRTLRNASAPSSQDVMDVEDETGEADDARTTDPQPETDDGLLSCPICGARMKEEQVWAHIDQDHSASEPSHTKTQSQVAPPPHPKDSHPKSDIAHISQFNYSLLKDGPLRRKLDEIGLSSKGPRELLIRRHTEWVNLYNANADSSRPRSTRELHRELQAWERSQGAQANTKEPITKKKDFDGMGWARGNKDQFDELVRQARAKAKMKVNAEGKQEGEGAAQQDGAADEVAIANASSRGSGNTQEGAGQDTAAIASEDLPQTNGVPPVTNGEHTAAQGVGHSWETKMAAGMTATSTHEDSIPSHFASPEVKKVPMFAVASEPINDMDGLEPSR